MKRKRKEVSIHFLQEPSSSNSDFSQKRPTPTGSGSTTLLSTLNIVVVVVVAGRGGDPEAGQVCRAEDLPAVPLLLGPEADVRGERLHAPRHIRDQVHLLTQGTGNSGHHLSSFFC